MCCASAKNNPYSRFVARIYDRFMQGIEQSELGKRRATLLRPLSGQILEIGAGTGVNFTYYQPGAQVHAIEPDAAMAAQASAKIAKAKAAIQLSLSDIESAQFDRHSMDAIVCTLVLCTVPDLSGTIQKIKKYLRPGGQLIILEHIEPRSAFAKFAARLIQPVWGHLALGCHLTRPTDQILKAAGFTVTEASYFHKGLPFYQAILTH